MHLIILVEYINKWTNRTKIKCTQLGQKIHSACRKILTRNKAAMLVERRGRNFDLIRMLACVFVNNALILRQDLFKCARFRYVPLSCRTTSSSKLIYSRNILVSAVFKRRFICWWKYSSSWRSVVFRGKDNVLQFVLLFAVRKVVELRCTEDNNQTE